MRAVSTARKHLGDGLLCLSLDTLEDLLFQNIIRGDNIRSAIAHAVLLVRGFLFLITLYTC